MREENSSIKITRNGIINIYDKKPHPNDKCEKIKIEWLTHCDILDRKLGNYKSFAQCNDIFDNYYKCYMDDVNNPKKRDTQPAMGHHK